MHHEAVAAADQQVTGAIVGEVHELEALRAFHRELVAAPELREGRQTYGGGHEKEEPGGVHERGTLRGCYADTLR